MAVATYQPKLVAVSVNGLVLSGYADGTFVTVERAEDSWAKVVGADGTVTRSRNPDISGSVTLTLKGSSPSNDVLTALLSKDEIDGSGVFAVIVKDNSGTTLCAGRGWIRRPPNVEFAVEVGNREWAFDLSELTMIVGGNTQQ